MIENQLAKVMVENGHRIVETISFNDLKKKYPRYFEFSAIFNTVLCGSELVDPGEEYVVIDDVQDLMISF